MAQFEATQFTEEIVNIVKALSREELDATPIEALIGQAKKNLEAKIPQALEICVADICEVKDALDESSILLIIQKIKEWYVSKDTSPLVIRLTKIDGRAPPALGISVKEVQVIKDVPM